MSPYERTGGTTDGGTQETIRFDMSIEVLVDGLKKLQYNLRDDSATRWDQAAGFVTIHTL
jgi:hypothetical protein